MKIAYMNHGTFLRFYFECSLLAMLVYDYYSDERDGLYMMN